MKKNIQMLLVGTVLTLSVSSCKFFEVDKIPDLNNPTVESVLANATRPQIEQLGVGVQYAMRNGYYDFVTISGSIGREIVIFNKTDSRYYTELQGQADIDPGGIFYAWYNAFSQTRRRAEVFTRAADQSTALTTQEKQAAKGFARTVQAFTALNQLNMMGKNGIRTEFTDLQAPGDMLRPGPFVSYEQGLAYVKQLVDEGATALDQGGNAFPFPVTSGFAGFTTPATFKRFNRAVAARVAMYQKDWTGMLAALNQSFMDLNGDLATGPRFTYSTTAGDLQNNLSQPFDEPNRTLAAQVRFVSEAEPGDTRVFGRSITEGGTAKIRKRTAGVTLGQYPVSEYELQQYGNTSPVSIIRNEELILMYAEAMIQTDKLAEAVTALNRIRTANGLKPLAEAKPAIVNDKAALIDELLNQRRYSLFMEGGHRWFDMRRYERLNQLPKDLPGHRVWDAYPIPQAERDWDRANG